MQYTSHRLHFVLSILLHLLLLIRIGSHTWRIAMISALSQLLTWKNSCRWLNVTTMSMKCHLLLVSAKIMEMGLLELLSNGCTVHQHTNFRSKILMSNLHLKTSLHSNTPQRTHTTKSATQFISTFQIPHCQHSIASNKSLLR